MAKQFPKFHKPLIVFLLTLILAFSVSAQESAYDLGSIQKKAATSSTIALYIRSTPQFQGLLTEAFASHGAFSLTDKPQQAHYKLLFKPVNNHSFKLSLEATASSSAFDQIVEGIHLRDAALRAADLAVEKMTTRPGFFAGRLAFVGGIPSQSEVFISDLFFRNPQQTTHDQSRSLRPQWSPDGQSLLYTSYYKTGFPDIFRINISTGVREPLISFQGTNTGATYSPSGRNIAMILSGTGNAEVYLSNKQGRELQRLTQTDALESSPSWSPDGTRLIFSSNQNGLSQLYTLSIQGGGIKQLNTPASQCTEPSWNPIYPNLIAFTVLVKREFEIALYDFNTQSFRVLTNGKGDAMEATWTRDGRHLIYTARRSQQRQLFLLDSLSGKKTALPHERLPYCWQADYVYPKTKVTAQQ